MLEQTPPVVDGIADKPKVPLGYILYTAFLPVIGLFLERYAYSFIVAVTMWVLVLILMVVSCALDKRMLGKNSIDTTSLSKTYLLPPLYIYKRQKLVGGEPLLCVACATLIAGALLTNGIFKGMRMTPDDVGAMVPNSAVTQLDNFSGNSPYSIGECVSAYSTKEIEWNADKKDYGFEVTATGEHNSKEFKIIFKVEFDGFQFHAFLITDVEKNGETLDKEGRKDFYQDVFINYGKKSDSSSQTDSSSASDNSSKEN